MSDAEMTKLEDAIPALPASVVRRGEELRGGSPRPATGADPLPAAEVLRVAEASGR